MKKMTNKTSTQIRIEEFLGKTTIATIKTISNSLNLSQRTTLRAIIGDYDLIIWKPSRKRGFYIFHRELDTKSLQLQTIIKEGGMRKYAKKIYTK